METKDNPTNFTESCVLSPFRFGKRAELSPVTEQEAAPVSNFANTY
jgi:hypothetical protein